MNILDIAIAKKLAGGGGGSGTDNYNDLSNLPKINGTTLSGNKSSSALGLQSEINSDSKLASDLVDDTNQDNKFVTSTEKNTWNGKQNAIDADHKINADYVDDSTSTNKFVTASDKETWNAKQNAIDNSHKLSSDLVDDTNHTNKFVTSSEKQTWNAKQNAIDSDHKLSSSLVSFTTAEAAALASGIDSSKVGQISTNQTNILYVLGRTGKNLYDIMHPTRAVNITVTDDGNGQFTQTASGAWAAWDYDFDVTVGTQYTVYIKFKSVTTSNAAGAVVLKDANGNDIYRASINTPQTFEYTFTAPTSWVRIGVTANNSSYNQSGTFVMQDPMVVEKAVYDKFSDYQPYQGRPNYDLTRLESEDRASLAEVVDSGAKNLLDFANVIVSAYSVTQTKTDTTLTVTGATSQYGNVMFGLPKVSTEGYYVISFRVTAATKSSGTRIMAQVYSNAGASGSPIIDTQITGTGNYQLEMNFAANTSYYLFIYPSRGSAQSSNSVTITDFMLCTKAAFGVSKAFVPYRPNYDLVGSAVSALNSTVFSPVYSTNLAGGGKACTDITGGYIRIGNLVVVNIRCETASYIDINTAILYGLPRPLITQSVTAACVNNNLNYFISLLGTDYDARISNGSTGAIESGKRLIMSCVYIAG